MNIESIVNEVGLEAAVKALKQGVQFPLKRSVRFNDGFAAVKSVSQALSAWSALNRQDQGAWHQGMRHLMQQMSIVLYNMGIIEGVQVLGEKQVYINYLLKRQD